MRSPYGDTPDDFTLTPPNLKAEAEVCIHGVCITRSCGYCRQEVQRVVAEYHRTHDGSELLRKPPLS